MELYRSFSWYFIAAASIPVALVSWFYLLRHCIPHEYRYRPGTISGYLATQLSKHSKRRRKTRPIRVYLDGCFDMMHYGHANALRQAKGVGDELIVGLVPDHEVEKYKGCKPVLTTEERLILLEAIKWVDEVQVGVPYELTPSFTNELFKKHRIDYVVHGDDPCLLPDGTDAYAYAKKLGRFKMIKRTEGVSTTDIVGRMLTCTRVNSFICDEKERRELSKQFSSGTECNSEQGTVVSQFMPTSRRIVQFSNTPNERTGSNVVYIDGAFDVFHVGHVSILKEAKRQGDFLLVGIHTDEDVMKRRGPHMPIMNLHERSLSVLACKYVDEVIIGVPPIITEDLMRTFNIALVVRGSQSEFSDSEQEQSETRYSIPRSKGMFKILPSPSKTTTRSLIKRIVENHEMFSARTSRKLAQEAEYYQDKKKYIEEL
eukprot:g7169.t1